MNRHFPRRDGVLHIEAVDARQLARSHGTPLYVYSASRLRENFRRFTEAFASVPHTVCYSVKSCSNVNILRLLAKEGCGFDIVSGGELRRVLEAGSSAQHCVFAGVGKTAEEIELALSRGIRLFNVESLAELDTIDAIAGKRGVRAPVALRVNPDVDPMTHRYITTGKIENKFGLDRQIVLETIRDRARWPHVALCGLHMHIGSQIRTPEPFVQALSRMREVVDAARASGMKVETVNVGGGVGIDYQNDAPAQPVEDFGASLTPLLREFDAHILFEPGRRIAGDAGLLLTRVLYVKRSGRKTFVIGDAGMHTLLRPSLYQAYHPIEVVDFGAGGERGEASDLIPTDVVGPICETGDFFAQDRPLPPLSQGDLLAVLCAGAYGMSMASTYNSHPLPAEVLVEGERTRLIRRRQRYEELWDAERTS